MKLATIKDGSRDGYLVVVSRDLTRCVSAENIAPTLQAALPPDIDIGLDLGIALPEGMNVEKPVITQG